MAAADTGVHGAADPSSLGMDLASPALDLAHGGRAGAAVGGRPGGLAGGCCARWGADPVPLPGSGMLRPCLGRTWSGMGAATASAIALVGVEGLQRREASCGSGLAGLSRPSRAGAVSAPPKLVDGVDAACVPPSPARKRRRGLRRMVGMWPGRDRRARTTPQCARTRASVVCNRLPRLSARPVHGQGDDRYLWPPRTSAYERS
jgi:hypothetical protein